MVAGHLVFAFNVALMVWGRLAEQGADLRAAGVPA